MNTAKLQARLREDAWASMCRSTAAHAGNMASLKSQSVRDLVEAVAQRFCDLPVPATDAELNLRRVQSSAASSIIAAIVNAETMAIGCPQALAEIYNESKALSERALPIDREGFAKLRAERNAYSSRIAAICDRHSRRRPR